MRPEVEDPSAARLLTTADAAEWDAAVPPGRSVFAGRAFAAAEEAAGREGHRLLVAGDIAYPLRLREVPHPVVDGGSALLDAASPPFTGPLGSAQPLNGAAVGEETLADVLREAGVVSEFAHLHPWDARAELVDGGEPDREIVWVDLDEDPERAWAEHYTKAARKNVRRAEREGVEVRAAASAEDISAFHRIYTQTMERNEALPGYFHDEDYFRHIFETMGGSARFALAERSGEVIAGTLYLHDESDVYSYLGGADHAHQEVRPTNAVVHATIAWAREAGRRRLILGGGYSEGDGIFRFKASFSPLRATLRLARRIHMPAEYDRLVSAWTELHGSRPGSGYFPAYRQPATGGGS